MLCRWESISAGLSIGRGLCGDGENCDKLVDDELNGDAEDGESVRYASDGLRV